MKFLGTFLSDPTEVPANVLAYVARQLRIADLFVQPSIKWTDPRKELLQGEAWTKIKPTICKGLDRSEKVEDQLAILQKQLDECYYRTEKNLAVYQK